MTVQDAHPPVYSGRMNVGFAESVPNRWNLPHLGLGLGLRESHIATILREQPPVDWFEIITENYLVHRGVLAWALDAVCERYPVVMHGVSLSIGSTDPLDLDYLRSIKALADRISAPWVSDHVCWTGVGGRNSHDLLPVPYTEEMLQWMIGRVRIVQDVLERPLLLENPSSYLQFTADELAESTFVAELANGADCALLLDVNNIYVSSKNHGFSAQAYLDAIPWDRVVQFHVAGHSDLGTHILDSHIGPVIDPVWELLRDAYTRSGGRAVMLEWDDEVPDFETTWQEAQRARAFVGDIVPEEIGPREAVGEAVVTTPREQQPPAKTARLMYWLHAVVAADQTADRQAIADHVLPTEAMPAAARVDVYTEALAARFTEVMTDDYGALERLMGEQQFADQVQRYLAAHPPRSPWLEHLGADFGDWLAASDFEPWYAELARLQWAVTRAVLAPIAAPVGGAAFAAVPAAQQGEVCLIFAPSVQLVATGTGVHCVLEGADEPTEGPEYSLVTRANFDVCTRVLDVHEAGVLARLMAGDSLQDAVVAHLQAHPDAAEAVMAQLGIWTTAWTSSHMVVGLTVAGVSVSVAAD